MNRAMLSYSMARSADRQHRISAGDPLDQAGAGQVVVEDQGDYFVPFILQVDAVQLEEGPRMMTNIVGIENTPENLVLDMPLEVVFEDATEEISIPKFRPAGA